MEMEQPPEQQAARQAIETWRSETERHQTELSEIREQFRETLAPLLDVTESYPSYFSSTEAVEVYYGVLRSVVEEVIPSLVEGGINNYDELRQILEEVGGLPTGYSDLGELMTHLRWKKTIVDDEQGNMSLAQSNS